MYTNLAEIIIALEKKVIEQEKEIDSLTRFAHKQAMVMNDLNQSCIILKAMADHAIDNNKPKLPPDYFKPGVN